MFLKILEKNLTIFLFFIFRKNLNVFSEFLNFFRFLKFLEIFLNIFMIFWIFFIFLNSFSNNFFKKYVVEFFLHVAN